MMIAFGVKVLFFVLSSTGLIASWIVLYAFGRVVSQQWAPMSFCIGNTILQGIFCLGMIYRMDPFLMPRSFCIAQTLCIAIGTYLMTGAAGALSIATSLAVLKPKTWGDGGRKLKWRAVYLYPTVVYPVVATIIHTVFVFKFDSVHPTDDLHCDSSKPEWVRFLSYAGFPFIPGLPMLYLSIKSVRIVYKTHQHIQRSRSDSEGFSFSQGANNTQGIDFRLSRSPITISQTRVSSDPHQIVPAISSPALSSRQFHLPLKPSPSLREPSDSGYFYTQEFGADDRDSTISASFPTFTKPDHESNLIGKEDQPTQERLDDDWQAEAEVGSILTELPRARVDSSIKSKEWMVDRHGAELDHEYSTGDFVITDRPHSVIPYLKPQRPPNLAPAVWRIIIFQFAFVCVEFLTCISTVIDVATHRPTPTPFGTQHIALLLAAWGPVVVFGHLPAVMRNLKPWQEFKQL